MKTVPAALAALLLLAPEAFAAAGDVAAGAQKAQACAGCHGGPGGGGPGMAGAPSLAGQHDKFLQWQLVFYRSGRRQNPIMTKLAEALSDEDVRDLGAYYASLPPFEAKAVDADPALHAAGAEVTRLHNCSTCHLDGFTGQDAVARVAGQREDYLVHALSDYRSGDRPSTGVGAMTEAASGLSDDEIVQVAHYLATLK